MRDANRYQYYRIFMEIPSRVPGHISLGSKVTDRLIYLCKSIFSLHLRTLNTSKTPDFSYSGTPTNKNDI